ncbi:AbiEi antitoxin N-terminal domain-containing protein [Acidimangrovimonas sediminis]|uniref:AbiEi antitoxin N-terminal domain-containing protein n=2 Tax=Albidovulum sediminis TaxID=3066345 RepID=A0ABT2NG64_9RHOB|nr:AbiEi antitoxin N-terminal domain-containing protein [Defluviimonas sediminis]
MYQTMNRLSQRDRLAALLETQPIVRAYELRQAGITPSMISRAVEDGDLARIARGLYQRVNAELSAEQSLAEASKLVPKGVIALTSALAFHELTDQMPRKVWVAISPRDWAPVISYPPMRITEFPDKYMTHGIERHRISGIDVPIFSVPKTLADVFRSRAVDRSVAIEALRAALRDRRATPGEIARSAWDGGAWKVMQPYLEALVSDG